MASATQRLSNIDHCYYFNSVSHWNFQYPRAIEIKSWQNKNVLTTSVVTVEIETSNLVGRLKVASASPWMANHP